VRAVAVRMITLLVLVALAASVGHSSINMTMRYVHHVEEHARPIPEEVLAAGQGVVDPDERVIRMLGARSGLVRGNAVATEHLP
jgi:hypothetical protein